MRYLNKIVDASLALILMVMAGTMAVNVFCRFILRFSISWADELCLSLMLWLTFVGAAAVLRDGSHYAFTYLNTVFKGKGLKVYLLVSQVLVLIAVALLLYWSIPVCAGISKWVMPALNINKVWIYGACPVGCVLMLIYCVCNIKKLLR